MLQPTVRLPGRISGRADSHEPCSLSLTKETYSELKGLTTEYLELIDAQEDLSRMLVAVVEGEAAIASRHRLDLAACQSEEGQPCRRKVKAIEQILLLYKREAKAVQAEALSAKAEQEKAFEPIKFENLRL